MEEQIQTGETRETLTDNANAAENMQEPEAEAKGETVAETTDNSSGKGITGSTLKIIAIISMFIDHFGASIVEFYLYRILTPYDADYCKALICSKAPWLWMDWMGDAAKVQSLDITLRAIGRLAFPIFCFLLVEGFLHTHNMKKYLLRLGLFALFSEVIFDFAFLGQVYFKHQNVFFTLFIAVLALMAADHVRKQESFNGFHRFAHKIGILIAGVFGAYASITSMGSIIGMVVGSALELGDIIQKVISGACGFIFGVVFWLIKMKKYDAGMKLRINVGMLYVLGFFTLAELLFTDYGGWGVLAVVAIWIARPGWIKGFNAGVTALSIMSLAELTAFLAALPVEMYNGKRGLKMKYFFYVFYPAHLLLFVLIRRWLLGM